MLRDMAAVILMSMGIFFFAIGVLGLFRFPDALTRIHAAAKCDTLGALLLIAGLIILNGWSAEAVRLVMIILFIWITNPTGSHAIARAAYMLKIGSGKNRPILDFTWQYNGLSKEEEKDESDDGRL
jgi:multicomponent Na+:H+ antiporter subunit G